MPTKSSDPARRSYGPRKWLNREKGIPNKLPPYYAPTFPLVFSDAELRYGRCYDVLIDHYLESDLYLDKAPLMRLEHLGCYQDLLRCADMGERFWASDQARRRGIARNTFQSYLDHLENLQLITRIRTARGWFRPIHIVMRAPPLPDDMAAAGKVLAKRITKKVVQTERKKLGRDKWPRLSWDWETMLVFAAGGDSSKDLNYLLRAIKAVRSNDRAIDMVGANDASWRDFHARFEDRVRAYCSGVDHDGSRRRAEIKFTDRLYTCAMTILAMENGG